MTRLDPLADLESPCCPLLSSNTLALVLGVLSGWNELMVVYETAYLATSLSYATVVCSNLWPQRISEGR